MFEKVLIAVDGSPTGRDAIALAVTLAKPDGRLTLAHILDRQMLLGGGSTLELDLAAHEASQLLLESERKMIGVSAELISVSAPSVGRGLHALAELHSADLLVIGSCHRGLAGRVLMGDDTRGSLNGAPCAVAIAPHRYADRTAPLTTVGVGYDFSGESEAALAAARALSAQHGSKLSALYVMPPPTWGYGVAPMPSNWGDILIEERKDAEDRITSLEGVDGTVVDGLAGEELAAFGDRVDLLVVGSRNYGPLRSLVLGSTSHGLARHARCPLLVLPRSATDRADAGVESEARRESVGAGA